MIATVTLNPAIDYTVRLADGLEEGTVARTNDVQYDAGGKGINVSKYLTALGSETMASGFVGGLPSSFLATRLETDGVRTEFVEIDGTTRLNTTILTDDGEYKINQDGPRVPPEAVDDLLDVLRRREPGAVVVAGSLPGGLTAAAIDRIAAAGDWKTDVDIDGVLLGELRANYGVCKPNRSELAEATGAPVGTVGECLEAAALLRDHGFDRVVASLGADGAVMATEERLLHAPAIDGPVVDTVGGGDALFAGFLAAINDGATDGMALRMGIAAAASVVSVSGTRVPSMSAVRSVADRVELVERSSE